MTDDEPVRRKRILNPGAPPTLPPHESRRAKQRRLKRPAHRPRDPRLDYRFEPNQEQRDLVKLMSAFGIPNERIARVIRNPKTQRHISAGTLEKRFAEELLTGSVEMDAICAGALAAKIREGNVTAIIWFTKNRWGWKDYGIVERNGVDLKVQVSASELARELEARGLPGQIFGVDKPAPIDVTPPRIETAGVADDPLPEVSDAESDDDRRSRQFLESRMQNHIKRWSH
jgi:hypothetical protein